jgi:hypothetical protein
MLSVWTRDALTIISGAPNMARKDSLRDRPDDFPLSH